MSPDQNSDVVIRQMPPEEWWRLRAAFEAARSEEEPPRSAHGLVVGAEAEGRLVGVIGAERCYVVSPLWVAREYRGTNLAGALARVSERLNVEGMREVLTTTSPHVERLAHAMNFKAVEGRLFRRG
jgi:hypothetical protein